MKRFKHNTNQGLIVLAVFILEVIFVPILVVSLPFYFIALAIYKLGERIEAINLDWHCKPKSPAKNLKRFKKIMNSNWKHIVSFVAAFWFALYSAIIFVPTRITKYGHNEIWERIVKHETKKSLKK